MDVHRCRFVPYPPAAINALAFSHASSLGSGHKGPQTLRLAVGRANGDIEIWNPRKGEWFQESIIPGAKDRSIEGLVWTRDPEEIDKNGNKVAGKLRLFSIGYSTAVTEWDLPTGKPIRHCTGNYGEIWCMAAQPRYQESPERPAANGAIRQQDSDLQSQNIAVGCADGAIVILSTADENLQFLRTLTASSSSKARVLSIAYQNLSTVVSGHADSTIRVFNVNTRQLLRSMSMGAGPVGGPRETLVWSVKCASDGTILSGDSTGTVGFWDGKTYTLTQRIKGHVADVLDIAVSADGKSVFSGSMDRRTTLYRRMATAKGGEQSRWKEIAHQRLHKHDVKALAAFETKTISVVVSGGLDTKPIITPIKEFRKENHRALSALPQNPPMCSAPNRRLLVSWWQREISVWRISRSHKLKNTFEQDEKIDTMPKTKLMSKIELQGEESITHVDISADGQLLGVSTLSRLKIFRLRFRNGSAIKVGKLDLQATISKSGAKIVKFSLDGKWLLIIRPDSSIVLHRLTEVEGTRNIAKCSEKGVLLRRIKRTKDADEQMYGSHGSYDRSISRVAFSADSKILAVGDLSGYIDTWVLEGHEDLTQENMTANGVSASESSDDEDSDTYEEQHPLVMFGQHWIRNPAAPLIPKLDATPLVFAFRPEKASSTDLVNGHATIHPTRHTPHSHSHTLLTREDRLFVLTSEHHIHEFEILAGRLTDWSRRNPTTCLPVRFRKTRERAMGAIWDVSKTNERIWLYGSSWLWMFDLAQDLSDPLTYEKEPSNQEAAEATTALAKRKRTSYKHNDQNPAPDPRKGNTGAGSQIPDSLLTSGIGRKLRKIEGTEISNSRWISLGQDPAQASEDDEDHHTVRSALVELRRDFGEEARKDEEMVLNGDHQVNDRTSPGSKTSISGPRCWCTYSYRSILGIVPFSGGAVDDESSGQVIEVALIERPVEDADLPEIYHGDQEWSQ